MKIEWNSMESTTTTKLQNEIVSRAVSRKLKLQLQCLCVCVCDSISRKCSNKDEMRTTKHNKIRSNEMYLCDVWVCVVCCVRNGGLHTKCINTTVADWAAVACRVHTTERYGRLVVCLCVCLSPQQHAALIRGAQNNNNNNTKDDDRKKSFQCARRRGAWVNASVDVVYRPYAARILISQAIHCNRLQ